MGLLSLGTPLHWSDAQQYADHVRAHGIDQFLTTYKKEKGQKNQHLLWGDENTWWLMLIKPTATQSSLYECSISCLVYSNLNSTTTLGKQGNQAPEALWRPEYGRYMLESTPGLPYGASFIDLVKVEDNMKQRRRLAKSVMYPGDVPVTLVNYPRLGCPDELIPEHEPNGQACQSMFVPDEIINPHVRFPTLTANIRRRRGSKVEINMPIYHDKNTPRPFIDPTIPWDRELFPHDKEAKQGAAKPDHIYMDAMAFGMGCLKQEERKWKINKSRYDSIDTYISTDTIYKDKYNDLDLVYDKDIYRKLTNDGVDDLLARHLAHLFIRDPLVIFEELLDQDDEQSSDHFENLQSTNWQTVRFKPPPPNSTIGWRVEFRSMEVQLTDFENAAFSVFIVLLTRTILSLDLNFYLPITKVDDNMRAAHHRGAVANEKFYFRKHVFTGKGKRTHNDHDNDDDSYEQMTMDEIMNGQQQQEDGFPGLIPLVHSYLNSTNIDVETRCRLTKYLDLISRRASGELMTGASYLRQLVMQHPDYQHDSVVSSPITYDIVMAADALAEGRLQAPELLGDNLL
ncbi:hypothetical protein [Absidia glauca]|uniref:Glutamate--cysteine ligase n=1 Tax=Absidia glauca TaxID=4829 RepID=A0A163LSY3_ABSGL|nr:hypothetical protein [Absidia glauca]